VWYNLKASLQPNCFINLSSFYQELNSFLSSTGKMCENFTFHEPRLLRRGQMDPDVYLPSTYEVNVHRSQRANSPMISCTCLWIFDAFAKGVKELFTSIHKSIDKLLSSSKPCAILNLTKDFRSFHFHLFFFFPFVYIFTPIEVEIEGAKCLRRCKQKKKKSLAYMHPTVALPTLSHLGSGKIIFLLDSGVCLLISMAIR
jgi:hypothetical protein